MTSTSLVISAASAPSAAPSAESVMVDRNSAIAATPSMDTAMKATAPSVRIAMSAGVIAVPDSVVAAAPGDVGGGRAAGGGRDRLARRTARRPVR